MSKKIIKYLFETGAIKLAPENEVFLTTSGLLSPYYINTHFLCGGEKASTEILTLIDSYKGIPASICFDVSQRILKLVESSTIYADVVKMMADAAKESDRYETIDYISGGERRDWFFSIPVANLLNKPLLYLFNDGLVLNEKAETVVDLKGAKSLHLADLLTVGSSYTSKWIPALDKSGVDIALSINCVDRGQGGDENLINAGIPDVRSLCNIDESFFLFAKESDVISSGKYNQLVDFYKDQFQTMRRYLLENPQFIKKALSSDEKTQARMRLTLDNDLYKLGSNFLSKF